MNDTTNKAEVSAMLANLADDIINLMLREHQSIHTELEDVSKLIGDASKSLTASFDELNTITANHNLLLTEKLQETNTEDKTLLEASNNIDKKIKKNQLNIVTALQFDDIVQQLTKHSQSRTSHIQLMFKKLAASLEELKKLDYEYNPAFNSRILELKQDIQKLRTELEKESPVKQSSLTTGKTELF